MVSKVLLAFLATNVVTITCAGPFGAFLHSYVITARVDELNDGLTSSREMSAAMSKASPRARRDEPTQTSTGPPVASSGALTSTRADEPTRTVQPQASNTPIPPWVSLPNEAPPPQKRKSFSQKSNQKPPPQNAQQKPPPKQPKQKTPQKQPKQQPPSQHSNQQPPNKRPKHLSSHQANNQHSQQPNDDTSQQPADDDSQQPPLQYPQKSQNQTQADQPSSNQPNSQRSTSESDGSEDEETLSSDEYLSGRDSLEDF
ncbi:MAG: hypothetical protein M1822_008932 [Bathelium mastoideum]|nr:MAG: hypothetical protein M1822_008932 [Bathelium mastoideum]